MPVILAAMENRGTSLRSEGKWACGRCPRCGGNDRFRVVFDADRGREFYSCRICGANGDDIQFLRDYCGMSFQDAKAHAERGRGAHSLPANTGVVDRETWLQSVYALVVEAARELPYNERALDVLERQRGIRPDTADRFMLGMNPFDEWVRREDYGLTPRFRDNGKPMGLCLPAGIVIPIIWREDLHGAQIRRFQEYDGNRYLTVPGSTLRPMVFEGVSTEVIIVVESYLDGMLVWQEIEGRYTTLALGSVDIAPTGEVRTMLERATVVLVALDSDNAGASVSWRRWMAEFPNACRCPIPREFGTDPGEAWRNSLDLAAWIDAGLTNAGQVDRADSRAARDAVPNSVRVGEHTAKMRFIDAPEQAQAAVTAIVESCPAIGVAVKVGPRATNTKHPHSGRHPKLSQVQHIAVYAEALGEVYVFDYPQVKRAALAPLWKLPVVMHDGTEAMRHIRSLRNKNSPIESTKLMAHALSNRKMEIDAALLAFAEITLDVANLDALDVLAHNAVALAVLFPKLQKQMKRTGTLELYGLMRDAQAAIVAVELDGIAFDTAAHGRLCARWAEQQAEWLAKLPEGMNIDSADEIRPWMVKVVPKERRRGWARDANGDLRTADENLILADDIPAIHALRQGRRYAKRLSTYGERFAAQVNPSTGRLHGMWSIGGMVTGRTSVKSPNLQGLPRDPDFRALFRAPKGSKLLVADVSQFQLRIAAHVAQDSEMLNAYAEGIDLHTATAATLAGVDAAEVSPEQRRLAKAANFALLFGQGVPGFRDYAARQYQLELTESEAEEVRGAWFQRFEGIGLWHEATLTALENGDTIKTAAGRVASENGLMGNALQQALAFQVQGTEAEIMLAALVGLHPVLRQHDALLALFVHDEVIIEVADDEETISTVSAAVESSIADAFLRFYPEATVEGLVQARAVTFWAEAK